MLGVLLTATLVTLVLAASGATPYRVGGTLLWPAATVMLLVEIRCSLSTNRAQACKTSTWYL